MSLSSRAIFDPSRPRIDSAPRRYDETSFDFYDRCSEPVISAVRDKLEEWFAAFPAGHARRDLLGRLRDGDSRQFHSAVWELYIHESLRRQQFRVAPNPKLTHTTRRVDFLATRGDERVYVECTVVSHSDTDAKERSAIGRLEAAIDASGITDYWLDLDFGQRGRAPINPEPFVTALREWIGTLDRDHVESTVHQGRNSLPHFEWREGDWITQVWAIPRGPDLRGRTDVRPLGILPGEDLDGELWLAARAKLELKAEAYGNLNAPYIIALDAPEAWPDEEQLAWAVLGPGAFTTWWQRDGFLLRPGGPSYEGVSGVLMGITIQPHSFPRQVPTLYENPDARRPVPDSVNWNRVRVRDGSPLHVSGRPVHEAFEVDEGWPGVPWPK